MSGRLVSPKPILGSDVIDVGLKAAACSRDPDIQITTMAMALMSMAKSLGIGKPVIARMIADKWDDTPALFKSVPKPRMIG